MKFLILFFLWPVSVWADFSGVWRGQGQLLSPNQPPVACTSMTIDIEQTETTFFVRRSEFLCGSLRIRNKNPQVLRIEDDSLWMNDLKLGSITSSLIETQLISASGLQQSFQLRLDNSQLSYADSVDWSISYSTQVRGILTREKTL